MFLVLELLTKCNVGVCVSVPIEGGGSYSSGSGGSERHPVPAEIHPGSK